MVVRDGVVAWLGADAIARDTYPDARVVDLDGAFVAPAFVDCHVHTTATGLALIGLDLRAATSRAHCLDLLAQACAASDDAVIWGHGWDDTAWSDGPDSAPSRAELDARCGNRPVYLTRVDAHSALASTALRAATPGLSDADGHHPDGPLSRAAHHLVRATARGLLRLDQRAAARAAALDAFAANGIAAVHECAGPDIGGAVDWAELRDTAHGVAVTGYWGQAVADADAARALIAETGAAGLAGDLFVDGALGSRTAWLRRPYADADCCGSSYLDTDTVTAHLAACTEAGITAGFHVIGDAAVDTVLTGLERVAAAFGAPAVARCGHRLEHLEMIDAVGAEKLGRWGVIASMQPNFDALWGGTDGMYARRLGLPRSAGLNPLALLASAGVPLAFGSDTPVTSMNPWLTVRAATNHQTPGAAISARAAFAACTRGGWRAAGVRDGVAGTLTPGAPASYAIWDADELTVAAPGDRVERWSTDPRSRVPALPTLAGRLPRCRQTVRDGEVLFDA
ncbi:amidohydrolase [Mycolicibacterium brumae]|uniref:Amidohydrolase n=1 Tax=Mycolicibacterium brumae TaxID=85968 RepID=A0A2G5PB38_9MYCO|nr:amidohydrolase family protein [Mycolicibacterium brumae]MCV7192904.1 amidohydrolase family protein [Mycolicibacterium brumae]PIB75280.1 amidohydrolase [Mycolicibacterium brumae]UWW08577.1 amidohydrolase family protein [Mycolicibacterium brumae]